MTVIAYVATATLYPHAPAQAGYGVQLCLGSDPSHNEDALSGGGRDTTVSTMLPAGIIDTLLSIPPHISLIFVLDRVFPADSAAADRWAFVMGEAGDNVSAERLWKVVKLFLSKRTATTDIRSPDYSMSEHIPLKMAETGAWAALFKCGPRPRVHQKRNLRFAKR